MGRALAFTNNTSIPITTMGGVGDGVEAYDGSVSATTTFRSIVTVFTPLDKGKLIWIENFLGISDFLTTIAAYVSAHSVILSAPPPFTVSSAYFRYGTDNILAIQATCNLAASKGWGVFIPNGIFLTSGSQEVYSGLQLVGNGTIASQIICCSNVPLLYYAGTNLESPLIEKLGLSGTSRAGSSGCYFSQVYLSTYRDLVFNYFGNYAILEGYGGSPLAAGFSPCLENVNTTACWLNAWIARSSLVAPTDYVGVVDVASTDGSYSKGAYTSSESYQDHTTFANMLMTGAIGSGFVAALALRGGNAFLGDVSLHGSEVGLYLGPLSGSVTGGSNFRCDQNQGHGVVVAAAGIRINGGRSHNNSWSTSGMYDGYHDTVGGNRYLGSDATSNVGNPGPTGSIHRNGFYTAIPAGSEANQYAHCHVDPGSFSNLDYFQDPGSASPPTNVTDSSIIDQTNLDPVGTGTTRIRNSDLSIRDGKRLVFVNPSAPSNQGVWAMIPYAGEWHFSVYDDAYVTETPFMVANRSGATVHYVEILANLVVSGNYVQFGFVGPIISFGTGTPNGVVTAVGGSVYFDGNGALWVKVSGVGNTGWSQAAFSGSGVPSMNGLSGALNVAAGTSPAGGSWISVGAAGTTITLSLPQNLGTTDNVTFANVDISGGYQVFGNQVVGARQTGVGNPSGFADATAQAWCQTLYNKLVAHGLIT